MHTTMANNAASSKRDSSSDSAFDAPSSSSRAQDDKSTTDSDSKPNAAREEVKIYKTISRVHRACNACRKQKARCDGPENPPCRRCKQVGIECVFEKPPKDPGSSTSAAGPDANVSADRIRVLETQMSGMQSMISELVASIKANTSAMNASPKPQASPRESASSSSPHSSRASRHDPYLQQQYAAPPHHRGSQAISPSAPAGENMHRYPPEAVAGSAYPPQRPPYPQANRSFGSSNSIADVANMQSMPLQASYPLQTPPFQSAYGHPPTRPEPGLLQQQPGLESFDDAASQHQLWAAANAASSASSAQGTNAHSRRRSASRVAFNQDERGRRAQQTWQHSNLIGSPSSPVDAAGHGQAGAGSSSWMAANNQPRHSSRHRWTSSDRAGSHSHSLDANLTPSDDPMAADDADPRETDLSNDQLSAPIEALRGLADAAAAAAESEGHTSNDSSDEKQGEEGAIARSKQPDSASTPTLQLVDEGGKRTALSKQDEEDGKSPRKKRRRNTQVESPLAAATAAAGMGGVDGKAGAGGSSSTTASVNAGANPTSVLSPSSAGRSGRMEAPGLVSSVPGDLVTLGLVNESDAMRLFETFQKGVPKFISIFHLEDEQMTSEEAYHHVRTTSYFLFNVMLAIGAKVECGGKSPSRLYQTCMAQAKRNAKDTMFSPVAGKAAVQAMVLLAAYSENGWLSLGLSIRMAQELGLDRNFQKLMSALPSSGYIRHPQPPPPPKHLTFYHNSPSSHYTGSPTDVNSVGGESADGKMGANAAGANAVAANAAASGNADAAAKRELDELKDLARGSRLWFFLFLFDHQASYGAGRPAMLSKHYVRNCRAFLNLNYPLTVKTDARFISTLELLIIRETHYDAMAPYDQPVDARMLSKMRKVTEELNEWHQYWSADFESRGYKHDSFFQQSLVLQCASAELYLSCTALRGIRDANDADQMGPEQKELIIQATRAADTCLSISVNAKEYREMLGWAPHYTHVTAAFACVFLIKIARLFPRQVDTYGIFSNAEKLASRLAEVPAGKYARVIRILLAQAWKKIADLSPAIGLYAALGAEGTRPGAITPAEIKTGGPSDSGISLLYKLLSEYQSQNEDGEGTGNGEQQAGGGGGNVNVTGEAAGSGTRTPGFSDLLNSGKWLAAGMTSPSVGAAASFGGLATGTGTFSPAKPAMFSHRGSISGVDMLDGVAWSSFLAPHDGGANHPIQLPLWMQESTGDGETSAKTPAPRSWGHADHYQSPLPHGGGNYTSPSYQMGAAAPQMTPQQQQRQQSLGVPPSPAGSGMGGQGQGQGQGQQGVVGGQGQGQGGQAVVQAATTNFDSVLSDLGLPLDGLDGLFVDLPMNGGAASGSTGGYSV